MKLVTDQATSRRMAKIRQKNTTPENILASWLRKNRIHFSRQARDLPGTPDFVNRRRKWAVWVHGCFWHRHEGCSRTTTPRRNRAFWVSKFEANVRRDRDNRRVLRSMGFSTFEFWECALERRSPEFVRDASRLQRLHRRRGSLHGRRLRS